MPAMASDNRLRRHPLLFLAAAGTAVAVAAVASWLALGGFQLGAYGGLTEEQRDTAARADSIALPLVIVGIGAIAVAAVLAAVRLVRRRL